MSLILPSPSTSSQKFSAKSGDEILTTDIEYGACDRTWNFYCEKAGATYRRQKINLPITNKEKFIADFLQALLQIQKQYL